MSRNYYNTDPYAHRYSGAAPPYNPAASSCAPFNTNQQSTPTTYHGQNDDCSGSAVEDVEDDDDDDYEEDDDDEYEEEYEEEQGVAEPEPESKAQMLATFNFQNPTDWMQYEN